MTMDINGMKPCCLNPLMECKENTNWRQNNIQKKRLFSLLVNYFTENISPKMLHFAMTN